MVVSICNSVGFKISGEVVAYAHSRYRVLGLSLTFIAEWIKMSIENPDNLNLQRVFEINTFSQRYSGFRGDIAKLTETSWRK